MGASMHTAFNNLIATVCQLYLYLVIVRILLQLTRVDFYNPVSQAIWQLTRWPLQAVVRVIPRWRNIDIAALLYLYLLTVLYILLMNWLWGLRTTGDMLTDALLVDAALTLNLLTFTMVVYAILSWVGPGVRNPAGAALWSFNEPLLRPIRRVLPSVAGIDFAPLVAILLLQFLRQIISLPRHL